MVLKIFAILGTLVLGYALVWFGDGLITVMQGYGWMAAWMALGMFGYSSILYFQARAEKSSDALWLAPLSFSFGETFFGICAKPISTHNWASPWLIFLLFGAIPLLVEAWYLIGRKPSIRTNVVTLHRK